MDQFIKFNELMNKSIKLSQNLNYYEALFCINNLISNKFQLSPIILCESYCLRGQIRYKLQDFNNSILDFDKAIELNPFNHIFYQFRADSKQKIYLFNEALEDYDISINLNPLDSDNFLKKGNLEFKNKNYKEAIKNFDIALKKDNNNYIAIIMKEFAYENLFELSHSDISPLEIYNPCDEFQINLNKTIKRNNIH